MKMLKREVAPPSSVAIHIKHGIVVTDSVGGSDFSLMRTFTVQSTSIKGKKAEKRNQRRQTNLHDSETSSAAQNK